MPRDRRAVPALTGGFPPPDIAVSPLRPTERAGADLAGRYHALKHIVKVYQSVYTAGEASYEAGRRERWAAAGRARGRVAR